MIVHNQNTHSIRCLNSIISYSSPDFQNSSSLPPARLGGWYALMPSIRISIMVPSARVLRNKSSPPICWSLARTAGESWLVACIVSRLRGMPPAWSRIRKTKSASSKITSTRTAVGRVSMDRAILLPGDFQRGSREALDHWLQGPLGIPWQSQSLQIANPFPGGSPSAHDHDASDQR